MKVEKIFKDDSGKSYRLELSFSSMSVLNEHYWGISCFERGKGCKKWRQIDIKSAPKEWVDAVKTQLLETISQSFEEKVRINL